MPSFRPIRRRPKPGVPARPLRLAGMLRRFGRADTGAVSIEVVIALPMLITALVACVLLSDMFRSQTTAARAAYSVADTLSRRVDPVDVDYLDGTGVLYRYLGRAKHGTWVRVSSVAFSEPEDRFFVVWSHHSEGGLVLNTETLNEGLHERIPTLPIGETVIVVEAGTEWRSFMTSILNHREFRQVVVTRPRFTSQLRYDDGDTIISLPGGGGTCDDGSTLCDPAT